MEVAAVVLVEAEVVEVTLAKVDGMEVAKVITAAERVAKVAVHLGAEAAEVPSEALVGLGVWA